MTTEFTPTTGNLRAAWQTYVGMERNTGPEFDRWLAALKAEVWAEGYEQCNSHEGGYHHDDNPYGEVDA